MKALLRQQLLARRRALQPDERAQLSDRIQSHLLANERFQQARLLGLYSPLRTEVDTRRLLRWALEHERTVAFPRTTSDERLEFVRATAQSRWIRDPLGFELPDSDELVPLSAFDVLVVPGVGFDRMGARLGLGKGYYDRALVNRSEQTWVVGLAFGCQQVERVPSEPGDEPVDALVTEGGVVECKTNRAEPERAG